MNYLKAKQVLRNNVNFNIPGVYWGRNSLSSSFGIEYQHIKFTEMQSNSGSLPFNETSVDETTLSFGIRYNRVDSLFHLPVNYNIGVSSKFSPDMTKYRVIANGVVFFQIIRNPRTSLSLGAIASTSSSSPVPLLPLISYYYKLGIWNMELFVDIPYRLALRKEFSSKSSISLGVDIDESFTFLDLKYNNFPPDVMYSSIDVKKRLTYEYLFSKNIILGISAGLMATYSSELQKQNTFKSNGSVLDNKSSEEFYFNVTLSMLPFLRNHKLK